MHNPKLIKTDTNNPDTIKPAAWVRLVALGTDQSIFIDAMASEIPKIFENNAATPKSAGV
jgi:hypothetical protein